jgi:ubiquinone/menaquinone biosynthesis C-methylase UbiE
VPVAEPASGLLGDTAARDYARKLALFNAFAAPELARALQSLDVQAGMHVLDAGCGAGESLHRLARAVGPVGRATGVDLSFAHVAAARVGLPPNALLLQGDLLTLPLEPGSLDRIWCANTINHFQDPLLALRHLAVLLRPGGRVGLAQSGFLPEMFFAWDSRLERLCNEAVRHYYRERYGVDERELAAVRAIAGLLRQAGLQDVQVQTQVIERLFPLAPADRAYLQEAIFRGTWGKRLQPYLDEADYAALNRLCDPQDPEYALDRPDFHFIATFTVAIGRVRQPAE